MRSIRSLSDAEFGALFRNFHESAFRLETRQLYAVEYEEAPFRDYLAGKQRYTHPDQAEYAKLVRESLLAGKTFSRVHVVHEPLSEYVKFEMTWPYVDSVQAGEQIHILPTGHNEWPQDVPREDYWLFDDRLVAVMNYDDQGAFRGANLLEDQSEVQRYVSWRATALSQAMPYRKYMENFGAKLVRE